MRNKQAFHCAYFWFEIVSAATRMISFPKFSPRSIPRKAAGAFSSPSTTSSRYRTVPSRTHSVISSRNCAPTIPTTRAPAMRANCPTVDPTGPLAAATTTVSPAAVRVLIDERGRPTYRDLFVVELANDETMRRAMSRATVAFLAVGSSPAQVDLEQHVIDAARQTSLGHLVKLSAALAAHDAVSSVLRVHAEIEDYLVKSHGVGPWRADPNHHA